MTTLIDRVKRMYELAFSDPARMAEECLAEDFVLENHLPKHFPFGGVYQGRDGFLRYLGEIAATMEMGPLEFEEWVVGEDSVVVRGEEKSLITGTGRTYHMRFVHWFTFDRDGRIRVMREFNDTAEMAKAFD